MAPDIEELSKRVDQTQKDHEGVVRKHDELSKDVHDFMILKAREDGEVAGYIKNAATDIAAIRKENTTAVATVQIQIKDTSEALWSAVDVLKETLSQEINARAVADRGHEGDLETMQTALEGSMETMKVDLIGKIRMAGYTKIIAFLSSAALMAVSGLLVFG